MSMIMMGFVALTFPVCKLSFLFACLLSAVPDKPQHVRDIEVSPNQVVLKIDPPKENGGVSIIGYRVEFENNIQDVSVSGSNAYDMH